MIGQVIQAIETLKKKEFFQAAVAVAKLVEIELIRALKL